MVLRRWIQSATKATDFIINMKKALFILTAFAAVSVAQADTYTWTGVGDGASASSAANWKDNAAPPENGADTDLVFTMDAVLSGCIYTTQNGSITVTGNSTVSLSNTYSGDVYIEEGSSLTNTAHQYCAGRTYTIDGSWILKGSIYYDNGSGATAENKNKKVQMTLGAAGYISLAEGGWNDQSNFNLTVRLATEDASMDAGTYKLYTRTLVTLGAATDHISGLADISFCGADGTSGLTAVSSLTDASAATANQYCFFQEGKDIKVTYVITGTAVPEPATATLSLLALAGLAARRRRK